MAWGVWQLARLSLRIESRLLGSHLARLCLTLFLLLAIVQARRDRFTAAPGLEIFGYQLFFTTLFLTVNSIFGFSQVITEEKEHENLQLLRLAGINSLAVILGKTVPRLCDSLLLVAIQFPFMLLTITLGGVGWSQVLAAYVALGAYLWLMAGIGVLASVWQPSGRAAVTVSAAAVFAYTLPFLVFELSRFWPGWSWLGEGVSLHTWLMRTTESGFDQSPWSPAVWVALGLGCVCFTVAWLWLDGATRSSGAAVAVSEVRRTRSIHRPWSLPFAWRDFRYTTGDVTWLVLRCLVQVGVMAWMMALMQLSIQAFAWSALVGGTLSIFDGTWSASRLFGDEIRGKTWSTLTQTPHSIAEIAQEKTRGWALGLAPSILMPYVYILLAILFRPSHIDFDSTVELVVGSLVTGLAVFAYLHLLVLLTLHWDWKAIPLTFTTFCGAVMVYVAMFVPWSSGIFYRCLFFFGTGVGLVAMMWYLRRRILAQLTLLSGTS